MMDVQVTYSLWVLFRGSTLRIFIRYWNFNSLNTFNGYAGRSVGRPTVRRSPSVAPYLGFFIRYWNFNSLNPFDRFAGRPVGRLTVRQSLRSSTRSQNSLMLHLRLPNDGPSKDLRPMGKSMGCSFYKILAFISINCIPGLFLENMTQNTLFLIQYDPRHSQLLSEIHKKKYHKITVHQQAL